MKMTKQRGLIVSWQRLGSQSILSGSVVPGINLQESIERSPKTKLLLDDLEKHLQATPDGQAIIMSHFLINGGGADILEAGLKEKGLDYGKFIGKTRELLKLQDSKIQKTIKID